MSKFNSIKTYTITAVTAAILSACGGSGSCPPSGSNNNNGNLSLKIEAPSQYPAGLPVTIDAQLTMTNTSSVDANNLVYSVPAPGSVGNYTGVTITPNAGIGSQSGACTNIPAGKSCTFTAVIGAYAKPGSFTVTATPNGNSGQSTKTAQSSQSLQDNSISVTANLGLVDTPQTNNSLYILPNIQSVLGNSTTDTSIMVSVWVKNNASAFDNIKLVDEAGNSLNYKAVGSISTQTNAVNTYEVTIPAGKSIQYIQAFSYLGNTPVCTTLNDGANNDTACSNNAIINLSINNVGVLNAQPNYFNLNATYTNQVVVLQNTGSSALTDLSFSDISSPLSISNNTCLSTTTLAPQATCTFTVNYSGNNAGKVNYFIGYNNGKYNTNTGITIKYGASSLGLLTASPSLVNLTPNNQYQSITITNTGQSEISNLTLPTLSNPLQLSSTTCTSGQSLASGASCQFNISYTNASSSGSTNLAFGYNNGQANYNESVMVNWIPAKQYAYVAATISSVAGIYRCPMDESGSIGNCTQESVPLGRSGSEGLAFATVNGVKYLYVTDYSVESTPVIQCSLSADGHVTSCNTNAGLPLLGFAEEPEYISFANVGGKQYAYISDPNYYNLYACSLGSDGSFSSCSSLYNDNINGAFALTTIKGLPSIYFNGQSPQMSDSGVVRYTLSPLDGVPISTSAKQVAVNDDNNYYYYGTGIFYFNSKQYAYTLDTMGSNSYLASCGMSESGIYTSCNGSYQVTFNVKPYVFNMTFAENYTPYIYVAYDDVFNPGVGGGVYKCAVDQNNGNLTSCNDQGSTMSINGGGYYDIVFSSFSQ